MCLRPCIYSHLNVSRSCIYSHLNVLRPDTYTLLMSQDLVIFADTLSHSHQKVKHPRVIKSPQMPVLYTPTRINTPTPVDFYAQASYSTLITHRSELMSVAYQQAQKQRYRITLELDVLGDFDPHQIDWEKLFKLEPAEKCDAYVEDLSTPDRW
jgi:hypothetical protein